MLYYLKINLCSIVLFLILAHNIFLKKFKKLSTTAPNVIDASYLNFSKFTNPTAKVMPLFFSFKKSLSKFPLLNLVRLNSTFSTYNRVCMGTYIVWLLNL